VRQCLGGKSGREASQVINRLCLGREPLHLWLRQQRIEAHQPLGDLASRHCTSVPVTRLPDGLVQPRAADVIEASAVVQRTPRGGVSVPDEPGEKLGNVVAVRGAGRPCILARQADAAEQHHVHEKARLTLGEPESHDGGDTVVNSHHLRLLSGSNGAPPALALEPENEMNPDRATLAA
jgi:hypothetical protein